MRNEIYVNFKLRMDQAFITIWENGIKRLRFDSRATDGVRRAESKNALISHPGGGGGGLPEKLGGGVLSASQNPYPIYDQNLRYSLPYL